MQNVLTLATDLAAVATATAVTIGHEATTEPAMSFYPGEKCALHIVCSGDFQGTVEVNGSNDAGVTFDQVMFTSEALGVGKSRIVQTEAYADMEVECTAYTAGEVSVYLTKGS